MTYRQKMLLVRLLYLPTFPFALFSNLGYLFFDSDRFFGSSGKLLSLIPGKVGNYLRTAFYMQSLRECHYDLSVDFCSFFAHPNARVGREVVIGSFSIIGSAQLEDKVLVSSRVSILSGKYQHSIGVMRDQDGNEERAYAGVRVGNSSWLGEGAVVMADVGCRCIVSAGSVVAKPVPDDSVAVGNPARFTRYGQASQLPPSQ